MKIIDYLMDNIENSKNDIEVFEHYPYGTYFGNHT